MEHAIIHSNLEKKTIKPGALMDPFLKHVADFNAAHFRTEKLSWADCPACSSKAIAFSFEKLGMQYVSCAACRTLYLNPRPSQAEIGAYFTGSAARQFWIKTIWEETAPVRRSKILEPFLDWVQVFAGQAFPDRPVRVAELYPVHWGLFEMWREKRLPGEFFLVEPYFAEGHAPFSLEAVRLPLSTEKTFDVICLPDTLAWVEKPETLFRWVLDHLHPGGLCFLTTIFSGGFDVMVLKEQASYFVPPERLNLFSLEALDSLVRRFPFEILECSTPGVLDMQNIRESCRKNGPALPDFLEYILERGAQETLADAFQDFLQANRLSSQGRMVLQKR